MGKPRMIIVIRHAQSEGNKNRAIHQTVPDHRVKLTQDGWAQARDAGHRLRSMLRPDDTLQFYTSPYRRARETTQGILESLTSDEPEPSAFPRHAIKVWEEPRLREQDFGNFQPCSAAMERMWQERADYGHFFYRIPRGESAADAYDRVSGFNETLWRSFGEDDFASVCVLVTHGLMTRVFLMKWFHWSVEYFEDLRNINHCEFVIMDKSGEKGKYILQDELRTWSDLKRKKEAEQKKTEDIKPTSPVPTRKRWGGCPNGCEHAHDQYPKRPRRQDTLTTLTSHPQKEEPQPRDQDAKTSVTLPPPAENVSKPEDDEEAFPRPSTSQVVEAQPVQPVTARRRHPPRPLWLLEGRDFGGSYSGAPTPSESSIDDNDYYYPEQLAPSRMTAGKASAEAEEEEWIRESGMASGARADALGDQGSDVGDGDDHDAHGESDAEEKTARAEVY